MAEGLRDMVVSKEVLLPDVNLTCVTGERYKTDVLSAYFVRPLAAGEAALNALLPEVLCRGNAAHPDLRSLSEATDDLFGAYLMGGVRKVGEWQSFGLSANFVGDAFTGTDQVSGMVSLLLTTLLQPVQVSGVFHPDYVSSERENLIDAIRGEKNEKTSYAMHRLEALACAGEPYGIGRLGEEDSVSAITPAALWAHYQDVLATSRLELFYCGQSTQRVTALLREGLQALSRREVLTLTAPFVSSANEPRHFAETEDVTQAKLAILWRTGVPSGHPDVLASNLASVIYGGSTTSKLFLNVRERLSLCYYASAGVDRHKGVMRAQSGVEMKNIEQAKREMLAQWAEVAAGQFTPQDVTNAKAALINTWRSQCDSPGGLEQFWHAQGVASQTESASDWECTLASITREDIIRVAKGFTLDTIYVMEGAES